MLNPFPNLLDYAIFAPTLLRITAAVTLFVMAKKIMTLQHAILATTLPLIGKPHVWMIRAAVAVSVIVGLFLLAGYETQWAALVGALIALKHGIASKKYKAILPFERTVYVLLFFICVSLLLTGAGKMAFDIPL